MSESGTASPVQQKDIRSAAKPFKRDRDSGEKWSMGTRPLAGVRIKYSATPSLEDGEYIGSPNPKNKVRPCKPWVYAPSLSPHPYKKPADACRNPMYKSHANKTPKPTPHYIAGVNNNAAAGRMVRKVDALVDADDHTSSRLSKSLLELLPQHANNTSGAIHTAIRNQDAGILYSYDNAGASPGLQGRAVGLDSLVDMAEKKWVMEQTEKIVQGEYEVLDAEGETTVLKGRKKKGSPKQRAVKSMSEVGQDVVEEDDGFELV